MYCLYFFSPYIIIVFLTTVTCQRLNEFGALDSNYAADSFAGLRQTARSMLASLMPKRNFGTPQICLVKLNLLFNVIQM